MPTIVDMRPSANTFRHATLIVIWLVVCLVGLGGCKSNLVKETCIDKPVWTTVVAKDCYTETVNQQTGSKLQAVKHVKESAKCGLKEAKDFVDTYCDYVL